MCSWPHFGHHYEIQFNYWNGIKSIDYNLILLLLFLLFMLLLKYTTGAHYNLQKPLKATGTLQVYQDTTYLGRVITQQILVVDLTVGGPWKLLSHISLTRVRTLIMPQYVSLSSLTPLHLDPLGLHCGYVKPLLSVDLADVVAGSQSPQRVPGALIPSGWSHCSLVFCYGWGEPEDVITENWDHS